MEVYISDNSVSYYLDSFFNKDLPLINQPTADFFK